MAGEDKQPNKPDGEAEELEDRGAIKNQSSVTPDDYPKSIGGKPDYGSPKRKESE